MKLPFLSFWGQTQHHLPLYFQLHLRIMSVETFLVRKNSENFLFQALAQSIWGRGRKKYPTLLVIDRNSSNGCQEPECFPFFFSSLTKCIFPRFILKSFNAAALAPLFSVNNCLRMQRERSPPK